MEFGFEGSGVPRLLGGNDEDEPKVAYEEQYQGGESKGFNARIGSGRMWIAVLPIFVAEDHRCHEQKPPKNRSGKKHQRRSIEGG